MITGFTKTVERFDHPLRFLVPSRRGDVAPYLVELDALNGNGECQCEDFRMRMLPLIERGFTPDTALKSGAISLPFGRDPKDALRCFHICEARRFLCDERIQWHGKSTNQ